MGTIQCQEIPGGGICEDKRSHHKEKKGRGRFLGHPRYSRIHPGNWLMGKSLPKKAEGRVQRNLPQEKRNLKKVTKMGVSRSCKECSGRVTFARGGNKNRKEKLVRCDRKKMRFFETFVKFVLKKM